MSLKDLIAKTHEKFSSPITKSMLIDGFSNLGVNANDNLIVHSSFSRLGYVAGGPMAVIKSLQDLVTTEGSITMPTHSSTLTDPSYWENPPIPKEWWDIYRQEASPYDPNHTATEWMGRIPELFRQLEGVTRSLHPSQSFSSWGKQSITITVDHLLTGSMSSESPLGKLYELQAKILFIGVDHGNNTSLHLAEFLSGTIKYEMQGAPITKNGNREWAKFQEPAWDSDDFEKVGDDFEKSHQIKSGEVGLANCKLIDMKELVDYATKWFKKHRKS